MSDITIDPKYDPYRRHIELARQNGIDWENMNHLKLSPDDLDGWFLMMEKVAFWPSLGVDAGERLNRWKDIVAGKRAAEQRSIEATRPLVVVGAEETEPDIRVPESSHTAWQLYRSHLEGQGWKGTTIDNIETSVLKILRHLRRKTDEKAVKGLVVGHVQSGKTANMAGLISMAADYRWNLFIVLTGTLENLRVQTRKRLIKDLNHRGNLSWKAIEHPSNSSPHGERAQDMQFHPDSRDRHLVVCLKNPGRLQHLIDWIESHKIGMTQMRVVVIDDEADQAGINTGQVSQEERSTINGLIVRLTQLPVQSLNYVAYTATPAANFLNEAPGSSLYPEDFIVALQQSDEHFGPVQIFGHPEAGRAPLGIVHDVSHTDLEAVNALHSGEGKYLPASLETSVLWFLCCVAAMRHQSFRKPVSMLIHTSSRQLHHTNVEVAVQRFLGQCAKECTDNVAAFLVRCAKVWAELITDLDQASFAERVPLYGRLQELGDYPEFDEISSEIITLLSEITAIQLDQQQVRKYHTGIHLCVDNCANNGITDENEVRRLFYPDPDSPDAPDFATAFIVIGGGTLSRGLTIENLVSTFFLRASTQADSLMQMGRWFGYRRGYELLPRIWMPAGTRQRFEFMTMAEEDLRDDLQRFEYWGARPSEFGPRVRVNPRMAWLRPTAKNKMQQTIVADYDFSGVNRQTTLFHDGEGSEVIHNDNLKLTETFLARLGDGQCGQSNSLVWRRVSVEDVSSFLEAFNFHPASQFFSEISPFLEWLGKQADEAGYRDWNVVAAGSRPGTDGGWQLPGGAVGLVTRSRINQDRSDGALSIGVLRDPKDLLADVEPTGAKPEPGIKLDNAAIEDARHKGEVGGIPQLLLYLIDKDSQSRSTAASKSDSGGKPDRAHLGAKSHIVGISLWLPGASSKQRSYATRLTVKIQPELDADDDDLADTGPEAR